MANTFKLFDENKANMLTNEEYNSSTSRLNGVQTGIASSQLHNKAMYQQSLMVYALAQLMNANGIDASDEAAVSTFVSNLSSTLLQKSVDKASSAQALAAVDNTKWVTPYLVKMMIDEYALSPVVNISAREGAVVTISHSSGLEYSGTVGSSEVITFSPKKLGTYSATAVIQGYTFTSTFEVDSVSVINIPTFIVPDQLTWGQISTLANSGNMASVFSVGQKKEVTANYWGKTMHAMIVGYGQDELSSGSLAKVTFVFEELCQGTTNSGTSSSGYSAWSTSSLRTTEIPNFVNTLPSALTSVVNEAKKYTYSRSDSAVTTTNDRFWTPSQVELGGGTANSYSGEGTAYSYFTSNDTRKKQYWNNQSGAWQDRQYMTRSPGTSGSSAVVKVGTDGTFSDSSGYPTGTPCVGFCI